MRYRTIGELQEMDFFRGLPADVIQTLLNIGRLTIYRKKQVVFRAGERAPYVHIVLEGEVMVYNLTKHGNRKVIFLLGKGRLLDHNIASGRTASVFCEAAGAAEILQVPRREFEDMCSRHISLGQAVMQEYERYIWRLAHQLKNTTGNMHMERKIAAKLWKLGRDFGEEQADGIHIKVDMTMTLLADLLGAPRETTSRACRTLVDSGLLVYQGRSFILPNPDGLADFYKA